MIESDPKSTWHIHRTSHDLTANDNCWYCQIGKKNSDKDELIKTINEAVKAKKAKV